MTYKILVKRTSFKRFVDISDLVGGPFRNRNKALDKIGKLLDEDRKEKMHKIYKYKLVKTR